MGFLKEFQDYKTEGMTEEEIFQLYFKHMVGVLSAIADEQHEANRLKRLEIEQMKKRRKDDNSR